MNARVHRSILTLILLGSITFFLGLGRQAISDSDEAFYAEAAREMVETGDRLTPHFNYEDRWQKPILYYWLTAATYLVTGPTEWAARLWSALSGMGLVVLTWVVARRMTGGPPSPMVRRADDTAWLAGAVAATCYGYFAMARLALPDLPLAFCMTATIWTALEHRWTVAGVAAALGFLLKGPIAVLIPLIVLVPIWWRERRLAALPLRELALAAAVFALIGIPWYGAMTLEHGAAYLQNFFVGDNLERFATDRFNEPRSPWFYIPIVIGGMLPWSMFLLVLPWRSLFAIARGRRRLTDHEWRLLLWMAVPLLFFTASIGKQPRYILPVLPPLAILLAQSIAARIGASRGSPAAREVTLGTGLTALLYAALAVLLYRARPLFITVHPLVTAAAIGIIAAGGGVFAWLAVTRQWLRLPTVAATCAAALLISVQFGALAGIRPEPVEEMAALVHAHRRPGESVGAYQVFVRNLVFYTRFKQVELFDEGLALDFIKSPDRVLMVVREADVARLESVSGVGTRTLGQVRYLDTANIRLRTLLWPIPEEDLDTVLLVANK